MGEEMKRVVDRKVSVLDTRTDTEKAVDEFYKILPLGMKMFAGQAQALKAKYDALIKEGFTEEQAMEIVKTRPLFE